VKKWENHFKNNNKLNKKSKYKKYKKKQGKQGKANQILEQDIKV
jgi:hypothetical protein